MDPNLSPKQPVMLLDGPHPLGGHSPTHRNIHAGHRLHLETSQADKSNKNSAPSHSGVEEQLDTYQRDEGRTLGQPFFVTTRDPQHELSKKDVHGRMRNHRDMWHKRRTREQCTDAQPKERGLPSNSKHQDCECVRGKYPYHISERLRWALFASRRKYSWMSAVDHPRQTQALVISSPTLFEIWTAS